MPWQPMHISILEGAAFGLPTTSAAVAAPVVTALAANPANASTAKDVFMVWLVSCNSNTANAQKVSKWTTNLSILSEELSPVYKRAQPCPAPCSVLYSPSFHSHPE